MTFRRPFVCSRHGHPRVTLAAVTLATIVPLAPLSAQTAPDTALNAPVGTRWELPSEAGPLRVQVVASGIAVPSSIAFLPDGRMLVSDRAKGILWIVDVATGTKDSVRSVPPVHGRVDGGLLDVVPHPDFARNRMLYLSYAGRVDGGSTTVLDRARLEGAGTGGVRLVARERLFAARPAIDTANNHFGSRIALHGGFVFLTIGDRDERDRAQDLAQHHGKVVRLREDGRVPSDNPFVGRAGALPEIWSLGHRNAQGLAVHPTTGELWLHEHGPRGGDEINIVRPGRNYGWPSVTFGREYDGPLVGDGAVQREGMEPPLHYWVPSIAPSGMAFYEGSTFPTWRGNLLVGAMGRRHIARLVIRDGRVVLEERLLGGRNWRFRAVKVGPDGAVYGGIDGGMVVRVGR